MTKTTIRAIRLIMIQNTIRRILKTEQNELTIKRGQTQVKGHDRVKKDRITNFINEIIWSLIIDQIL